MSTAFTHLGNPAAETIIGDVPLADGSLAALIHALGDVPLYRIRTRPAPGTATEQDVVDADAREDRLCELVDGVLVEKGMGYEESALAAILIELLGGHVRKHRLGIVTGESGMVRLMPNLVRIPDVAFISRQRFPTGGIPRVAIPDLAPDLPIEVLSRGNTPREMERKLREYFTAGARQVWYFDPVERNCTVYTSPDAGAIFNLSQTIAAPDLLPGFSLNLGELYSELDKQLGRG